MLSEYLGFDYKKNSTEMYAILKENTAIGIQNARKLKNTYTTEDPFQNSPSTTVFLLVEELLGFGKK